jgi:hypothetical protein
MIFLFSGVIFCTGSDKNNGEEEGNNSLEEELKKPNGYPKEGYVEGYIRQIGNSPFIETVITGISDIDEEKKKRDYTITGDLKEEIEKNVYKKIKAFGIIDVEVIKYAGESWDPKMKYKIEVTKYEIISNNSL